MRDLNTSNQAKLNEAKKKLMSAQADAKLLKNRLEGEIGNLNKQLQDASLDKAWDKGQLDQLEAERKRLNDKLLDARNQIGQLQDAAKKAKANKFKQPSLVAQTRTESKRQDAPPKPKPPKSKPTSTKQDGTDTQLRDRVDRLERRRDRARAPAAAKGPTYIGGGGAAGGAAGGSGAGGAGGGSGAAGGRGGTADLLAKALQQLAAQKKAKSGQKAPLKKKASATAKKAFAALKKQKTAEINSKKKAALKAAEERVKQLPKKQQPEARRKAKALIKKQFDAKKKLIPKSTKGMGLPELGTAIKRLKVMKV